MDKAKRVVRELSRCDIAPDAEAVEPFAAGSAKQFAQAVQRVGKLIDDGGYGMADNMLRAMSGCQSMILDGWAMRGK